MAPPDFAALYQQYQGPILHYAAALTGNPTVAEDIAGAVWLKVWTRWAHLDARNVRGYLFTATHNTALDWRRRARWTVPLLDPAETGWEPAAPDDLCAAVCTEETAQEVHAALAALPPRLARALHLAYGQERSTAAVGAALGITPSAAKSLLFRARAAYRNVAAPP